MLITALIIMELALVLRLCTEDHDTILANELGLSSLRQS